MPVGDRHMQCVQTQEVFQIPKREEKITIGTYLARVCLVLPNETCISVYCLVYGNYFSLVLFGTIQIILCREKFNSKLFT